MTNLRVSATGLWLVLVFTGCSFSLQSWQYNSALKSIEEKKYQEALDLFSRVIRRDPENKVALDAARQASRIAEFEVKNYGQAAEFYRDIIMHSNLAPERLAAQKSLANLLYDKIRNYDQAVIEFSRLMPLLPLAERMSIQLKVARSQYNLNSFGQALIEVQDLLEQKKLPPDLRFETLIFKGHLLQTSKKLAEAVGTFSEIIEKYPGRAKAENVGLSLAVCYEELGEFDRAIQVLEKLKAEYPTPEFIQIRINRLRERMSNLPGAQGFRR